MTALPKNFTAPRRPPRNKRQRRDTVLGKSSPVTAIHPPTLGETVSDPLTLPQQTLPTRVQFLQKFQQATNWLTLGFVGAALGLYGWSVTIPKQWSQEFHRLQTLQQHERQLLLGNEAIKNQLAQQAVQGKSGLVKVVPQQNLFLTAKVAPGPAIASPLPTIPQKLLLSKQPIAY